MKKLKWTDVHDIAIELEEAHPEADVVNLRFTDLCLLYTSPSPRDS